MWESNKFNTYWDDDQYNQMHWAQSGLCPCSFDMGWQVRRKGHNLLNGQAAVMSSTTGKVLHYIVHKLLKTKNNGYNRIWVNTNLTR